MSEQKDKRESTSYMPDEATFKQRLEARNRRGLFGRIFYYFSITIAILALITLFSNVVNQAFGAIATTFEVEPDSLAGEGRTLEDLSESELADILVENVGGRLPVIIRNNLSQVPDEEFTASTLSDVIPKGDYPEGMADLTINDIRALDNAAEVLGEVLELNLSRGELRNLVLEEVAKLQFVGAWKLSDAIFNWTPDGSEQARIDALPDEIVAAESEVANLQTQVDEAQADIAELRNDTSVDNSPAISNLNSQITDLNAEIAAAGETLEEKQEELETLINTNISTVHATQFPEAKLTRFYSWITPGFLVTKMSSTPAQAGIRTALLGSIYMMLIVIFVALPIGVGAALYLEEYANDSFFNRLIETNVRNLAGVPSIIYGLLGLAIFVRVMAPLSSGILFGYNVDVPSDTRITGQIADVLEVEFIINDDGDYEGVVENDVIGEEAAQNLVNVFRKYGTPGFNNMRGEIGDVDALREVRNALGLSGTIETTDEEAVLDLGDTSITVAQYNELVASLKRFASFTVAGRTLLSAALTLALLILPIIIINAQEALRAVPYALREGSYGLGATKWQTIWRTVLPAAVPGIMTGTILSVSRAVGETAPLIVVGASTFLLTDPNSPFSKFTALPIQIYQWTARPQGQFTASPQAQFQFIAAAAIIILLILVISLNAIAIVLRNRFSIRY